VIMGATLVLVVGLGAAIARPTAHGVPVVFEPVPASHVRPGSWIASDGFAVQVTEVHEGPGSVVLVTSDRQTRTAAPDATIEVLHSEALTSMHGTASLSCHSMTGRNCRRSSSDRPKGGCRPAPHWCRGGTPSTEQRGTSAGRRTGAPGGAMKPSSYWDTWGACSRAPGAGLDLGSCSCHAISLRVPIRQAEDSCSSSPGKRQIQASSRPSIRASKSIGCTPQ
jgi:hypothetical protein